MTTLLITVAVWATISFPVSVATGRLLARRSSELDEAMERHPAGGAR
jgi:hypothetical protein